jgi:hypothetical protein
MPVELRVVGDYKNFKAAAGAQEAQVVNTGSKPAPPLAPCDGNHDQSRHEHDENKQA